MDSKDRKIARTLQRNGKMTNQALADEVGLSPSPCLRRVRIMEEAGIIRGYAADVDHKKYGLSVAVFISIRLERHDEQTVTSFETEIKKMNEVVGCYMLTGEQDYLLHVMVADLDGYDRFIRKRLHQVGGIGSIASSMSYSTIKQSPVFPDVD